MRPMPDEEKRRICALLAADMKRRGGKVAYDAEECERAARHSSRLAGIWFDEWGPNPDSED